MISSMPGERFNYDKGIEEERLQRGVVDIGINERVAQYSPELVVYIGPAAGNALPSVATFKAIKSKCPIICLSLDASCPDWHPLINHYLEQEAFSCIVNCDGNKEWPGEGHSKAITMFHVIDPDWYKESKEKDITFGFSGGLGSLERRSAVEYLSPLTGLQVIERDEHLGNHQKFCDWMLRCKWQLSIPHSGSGKSLQMKARIIESARAKCCVLERKGAATENWFEYGHEYIRYENYEEIPALMESVSWQHREDMALRMHQRAAEFYSTEKFWEKVLARV